MGRIGGLAVENNINENSWHDDTTIQPTETKYVWFSQRDRVYWFQDEAEQLNGPYLTEQQAREALNEYVKHL